MKILSRYITQEALVFISISLFAFVAVLLTVKMLHFAALIIDKGVALRQIGQVFISIVPTFLEIAIPLATLLGVMLGFARLSGDSEIVVMRTSGISLYQLVRPVLALGVFICCVCLFVSHQLKPWGYGKLAATLFDIAKSRSTSGLEEGVFNKLGTLIVYSEKITGEKLTKVIIDDRRENQRKVITAKTGRISSNSSQRSIILELYNGTIHEMREGRYVLTNFGSNRVTMDADEMFQMDSKGRQTNELYYPELKEAIQYYSNLVPILNSTTRLQPADFPRPIPAFISQEPLGIAEVKKKMLRLQLELGQRFSLPFASLALALLALPLGVQPPRTQRTWGAGLSVSLGMLVFMLYYGMFSVGLVFARNEVISPEIALWSPNVCVFLAAMYFIKQTASEKWQSIADGLARLLQFRRPAL